MTRTCSWQQCASLCSVLLLLVLCLPVAAATGDYRLSSGDTISIHVYGEDDLTLQTRLGESGVINYPYLGVIKVKGLTVAELESRIVSGLKGDYLINPSVHISITEYRPFYIYGEVKAPGGYPYQPGLTVERAVALAGGLTERASIKDMTINRILSGQEKSIRVSMSTSVYPDDSILIKDSFF
ncbi:polysaccharide export protein [Ferrimonas sediminicola]|uniref:Polysaccharide export protein n=1 Tax=Ferrimonas sediminicola TaxID=2569538 RepID=A0A4U1BBE7_9GAMM|nr:polysaccharide biosynthesis/export family protein [Ferrimonas sediminicola]TKB48198.1 polysaccharide export protein [Ferrimonas sediminicola]